MGSEASVDRTIATWVFSPLSEEIGISAVMVVVVVTSWIFVAFVIDERLMRSAGGW
jgi:hypothetical protein